MSEFNFDEPEPKSSRSTFSMAAIGVWDILSVVVILITICMGIYFVMIFIDPISNYNPLKPAELRIPTLQRNPRMVRCKVEKVIFMFYPGNGPNDILHLLLPPLPGLTFAKVPKFNA